MSIFQRLIGIGRLRCQSVTKYLGRKKINVKVFLRDIITKYLRRIVSYFNMFLV